MNLFSSIRKKINNGQKSTYTSFDRYPEIFTAVKSYIERKPVKKIKILSYGCSTGDECFSLKKYFPYADIYGCDINQNVLEIAQKRNVGKVIKFFFSSEENIKKHGKFDIIFCMSSMCYFPDSNIASEKNTAFPFRMFEKNVSSLDENLNKDGILVIYNANYNFLKTSVSNHYNIIIPDNIYENGYVNKFNTNSRPFTVTLIKDSNYCHQIVDNSGEFKDFDLVHCIYEKNESTEQQIKYHSTYPSISEIVEPIFSYSKSDSDIFLDKNIINTVINVDVIRGLSGTIYEKINVKKTSVKDPSKIFNTSEFVRIFSNNNDRTLNVQNQDKTQHFKGKLEELCLSE